MSKWLSEVSQVVALVEARLEQLGESEKIHVEALAQEVSSATSIKVPILKLMIASLVNSLPGFRVSRGKFGGIMRGDASKQKVKQLKRRPKAQVEVPEVVAANTTEVAEEAVV